MLTLVVSIAVLMVFAVVWDIAAMYAVKVAGRHALNMALRAAVAQIDVTALQDPVNPRIVINETDARREFDRILQINLRLDSGNNPVAGSIADGPVEVVYFKVVNSSQVPFSYSYGDYSETITRPGATAIIKIPVRLSGFARIMNPSSSNMEYLYVHSTVIPQIISKHLEEF